MYFQVKEPDDFRLWRETMETEFPSRFKRLFAGPYVEWARQGCDKRSQGCKISLVNLIYY